MNVKEGLKKLDAALAPHVLYLVVLEGNDELFCKIGITKFDVQTRFQNENYNVLKERVLNFSTGIGARGVESILLEQILDYKSKYKPLTKINGFTECYDANAYSAICALFDMIEDHFVFNEFKVEAPDTQVALKDILNDALVIEPDINKVKAIEPSNKSEKALLDEVVDFYETSTDESEKDLSPYMIDKALICRIAEKVNSGRVSELTEEEAERYDKSKWRKTEDGGKEWVDCLGQLHKSGGEPAVIKAYFLPKQYDHTKEWLVHGKRHREDGEPAIERSNKGREWWVNDMRYREGGLAQRITGVGIKYLYINNTIKLIKSLERGDHGYNEI